MYVGGVPYARVSIHACMYRIYRMKSELPRAQDHGPLLCDVYMYAGYYRVLCTILPCSCADARVSRLVVACMGQVFRTLGPFFLQGSFRNGAMRSYTHRQGALGLGVCRDGDSCDLCDCPVSYLDVTHSSIP